MVQVPRNRIVSHPGTLLLEQITEMGLTVNGVARDVGLPATRLHEIVHERRHQRADGNCAGCLFLQTPEFWMNAQTAYELSRALVKAGPQIRSRIRRQASDRVAT